MKLIFIARKALAAYLASSADSRLTNINGALRSASGLYSRSMIARARGSSQPTSTRSGWVKSWIAEPSRRNSGFEHTAKSASGRSLRRRRSISRLVPTGTVDLVVMTVKPVRCGEISSTAANT